MNVVDVAIIIYFKKNLTQPLENFILALNFALKYVLLVNK